MKLSTLFTINTIVALLFGLGFVLMPVTLVSLYGATLDPVGVYVARLFGATVLGYTTLVWLARNTDESAARRAIVLAMLVSWVIGLVCALIGQFSGVVNALGWTTVGIYLLFSLGYGYFQFMNSSAP